MWASLGKWVAQALLIPLIKELATSLVEWLKKMKADREAKKAADERLKRAERYEQNDPSVSHDDMP